MELISTITYSLLEIFKWLIYLDTDDEQEVSAGTSEQEIVAAGTSEQEIVAAGASKQRNVADGTSGQEVVLPETAGQEVVAAETSGQEVVLAGTSGQEVVAAGTSGQELVLAGTSGQEVVAAGTSGQEVVLAGTSGQEVVAAGTSGQKVVAAGSSGQEVVAAVKSKQKRNGAQMEVTTRAKEEEVAGDQEDVSDKIQLARLVWVERKKRLKGQNLARSLYHNEEFRCREVIQFLSNDMELADTTVKVYVSHFDFTSVTVEAALRFFLRLLWPEDEIKLQHLFIKHFSFRYLKCNNRSLHLQKEVFNLAWAIILLNADLHGAQEEKKKLTCEEFIKNLNRVSDHVDYSVTLLTNIYKSIKMNQLRAFKVKSRLQDKDKEPTFTIQSKTGHLMCKRVMDANRRKTRMFRRSWKPFSAVLKGMVLKLESEEDDYDYITISLHHAVAYPLEYKNMLDVLYLKTADSRVFYFQAECEEEQKSWISTINLIAARYSAPPLTSATNTKALRPQVLPTFLSRLPLERQLEYTRDQLQKVSEYMSYYKTVPFRKDVSPSDYIEQEVKRYTTYVRALEKLEKESNVHKVLPQPEKSSS